MYEYFFMRISKSETFRPIASPSNSTTIIHSTGRYMDPKTQKKDIRIQKNCCLINKVFDPKKDEFVYKYKKFDTCKSADIGDTYMQTLKIEGVNGWDNNYCRDPDLNDKNYDSNKMLGSCKNVNHECKDFTTKENCKKFRMEWTDKTCQTTYQKPFKTKFYKMQINGNVYKL